MMRTRFALLLTVPALALGACGGGDSDEDKIKSIINDGAENPASVCDNASKKVLDQLGGKDGCETQAKEEKGGDKPDSIDVKVDGEKATAKFKDDDGDNTVEFVKEDGDWKVGG